MALFKNKQTKTKQRKTSFAPRKAQSRPILGMTAFTLGILFLVALLDFELSQSSIMSAGGESTKNMVGALGATLSDYSIYYFGVVVWAFPLFLMGCAKLLFFKQAQRVRPRFFLAFGVCLIAATGIANLVEGKWFTEAAPVSEAAQANVQITEIAPGSPQGVNGSGSVYYNGIGGGIGNLVIHPILEENVGPFGVSLLVIVAFIAGLVFLITDNIHQSLEGLQQRLSEKDKKKEDHRQKAVKSVPIKKSERKKAEPEAPKKEAAPKEKTIPRPPSTKKPIIGVGDNELPSPPKRPLKSGESIFGEEDPVDDFVPEVGEKKKKKKSKGSTLFSLPKKKNPAEEIELEERPAAPRGSSSTESGLKIIESEVTEKAPIKIPERRGDYEFPSLELLTIPEVKQDVQSTDEHHEIANSLVRTLEEFGVKVSPGEVHSGPVITRYEVTPAPGVRVEKILNLDKNIALGLRAEAVRILAPVPGKGTVGIEVPNKVPVPVCMREIVESRAWADSKAEIPVVLGKDVTGRPIVEDLTKMPHMLIAGSTGAGKTVCINAIIASLLYHAGPDDLRFIMVDPKVVEMQVYNALPHMLIPVVTDPKKVPGALKYLINEMEKRYQIFAKVGVRNIAGFNAKIVKDKEEREKAKEAEAELDAEMSAEERVAAASVEVPRDLELEVPDKKMHYIVCIIDELADLMMVAPQDIETGVARIAQLARAAGIHLILATQRPSVNVITGVIKANLPTRISFKVASKIDSRTILDGGGAEALIGKGDMLFIPPGTSNLVRAQGAFVSDDEINSIVDYLKKNGPPLFEEAIQQQIESGGEDAKASNNTYEDELVPDAIGVLKASKRASTSMLQRRLKIGYNRAARIMEILEDEGIVGPENGSSPREILKDLDML